MGYNDSYNNRQFNKAGINNQKQDLTSAPEPVKFRFYTTNGKFEENLFDYTAKKIAESFIGKNGDGKKTNVTSTQLRKFFNEVKSFEKYFTSNETSIWEEKKPYIKMIKSKVAYYVARKKVTKGVYKNFEDFMTTGINLINEEKDYFTFVSLFEAVYGFYCQVLLENGFRLSN